MSKKVSEVDVEDALKHINFDLVKDLLVRYFKTEGEYDIAKAFKKWEDKKTGFDVYEKLKELVVQNEEEIAFNRTYE